VAGSPETFARAAGIRLIVARGEAPGFPGLRSSRTRSRRAPRTNCASCAGSLASTDAAESICRVGCNSTSMADQVLFRYPAPCHFRNIERI
jgi:hypothetical protein